MKEAQTSPSPILHEWLKVAENAPNLSSAVSAPFQVAVLAASRLPRQEASGPAADLQSH